MRLVMGKIESRKDRVNEDGCIMVSSGPFLNKCLTAPKVTFSFYVKTVVNEGGEGGEVQSDSW